VKLPDLHARRTFVGGVEFHGTSAGPSLRLAPTGGQP
jgi:hypothetical protein